MYCERREGAISYFPTLFLNTFYNLVKTCNCLVTAETDNLIIIICFFFVICFYDISTSREFRIQCVGVGVHPPLDLSKQVIHFEATSLYDVSTARVDVINSHNSMNEFTHPVPRIGKGL